MQPPAVHKCLQSGVEEKKHRPVAISLASYRLGEETGGRLLLKSNADQLQWGKGSPLVRRPWLANFLAVCINFLHSIA